LPFRSGGKDNVQDSPCTGEFPFLAAIEANRRLIDGELNQILP
jgi:hypothetical protein